MDTSAGSGLAGGPSCVNVCGNAVPKPGSTPDFHLCEQFVSREPWIHQNLRGPIAALCLALRWEPNVPWGRLC